jgi:hypothetical protein
VNAIHTLRPSVEERVTGHDWSALGVALDASGWAIAPRLVSAAECEALVSLYARAELFRSRVHMAAHGFGQGEYQYFVYPLPALVEDLRAALYPHLVPIANQWNAELGATERYPADLETFLGRCQAAGQTRPTPLLLKYGRGDYNRLHQDLYGPTAFPLQVVVLLSEPGRDFTGGAFVLAEQAPRRQTRVEAPPLAKGDAVIFASHHRSARGRHGPYRVNLRHGVTTVLTGQRFTLGLIFHDAV